MFRFLGSVTKAVAGIVVETPVAMVADLLTAGGAATDREETYSMSAVGRAMKNIGVALGNEKDEKDD